MPLGPFARVTPHVSLPHSTISARMNASDKSDICEQYHSCLEKRVKQGDSALLCQDHTLYEQNLLSEGDVQILFNSMGVNLFAIMEASIQNAGSGLEGLAKAFEVLELAALNLYLCPWRKEYKTIKVCVSQGARDALG